MTDDGVRWSISRRPHRRMLAWTILLGALLALASAFLVQRLMVESDPVVAGLVGLGLGLFLVFSLHQGSAVRIEGRTLVYALRGHDCVTVDTRRITGLRFVATGALAGIGVDCPLDALTFVSRKGVSRRQCEATLAHLGVPLVLEFLRPEDLAPLEAAWRAAVADA